MCEKGGAGVWRWCPGTGLVQLPWALGATTWQPELQQAMDQVGARGTVDLDVCSQAGCGSPCPPKYAPRSGSLAALLLPRPRALPGASLSCHTPPAPTPSPPQAVVARAGDLDMSAVSTLLTAAHIIGNTDGPLLEALAARALALAPGAPALQLARVAHALVKLAHPSGPALEGARSVAQRRVHRSARGARASPPRWAFCLRLFALSHSI